jgi:hypothetical protein
VGEGAGYCVQTLGRLTSPGSGGSSASVSILSAARGVRSGTLGRLEKAATIGSLPCLARLTQWRRGALGSLGRLDHRLRRPSVAQEAGSEGIAVGRRQTPSIDGRDCVKVDAPLAIGTIDLASQGCTVPCSLVCIG